MKPVVVVAAVLPLLLPMMVAAAAATSPPTDSQVVAEVKREILRKLKDPESARFRDVRVVDHAACGEINAKNSYGGYVGFRRFYGWQKYSDSNRYYTAEIEGYGDELQVKVFSRMWDSVCARSR
jgi:hypothetical protein